MEYRYYLTQRPPSLGTFPKPKDNRIIDIVEFEDKKFIHNIYCKAWGYVEYEKPLTDKEISDYELID